MIIEILVSLVIALLPIQFALNARENIDLVTTRVLIPIIFLLWFVRGFARKKIWVPARTETIFLALFLIFSAASLIFSEQPGLGIRKLVYLFTLTSLFFVLADIVSKKKWRAGISRSLVVSGFLAAAIALIQFSLQFVMGLAKTVTIWRTISGFFLGKNLSELVIENSSWLVNVSGITLMRSFGFFPDPHAFSFFISLVLLVSIGLWFAEKNSRWKLFTSISIILMLLASILSFSRGAYLGLITSIIFFIIVYLKRSSGIPKLLISFFAIILVASIFFSGFVKSRLFSSLDPREGSNTERIHNWEQALDLIKVNSLSGVGLGNYARSVDSLAPERSSIYAHNVFLDISAETGLLNGIIFFVLLLVSLSKHLRSGENVGIGFSAALVYFMVHGAFDTPIYSPQVFVILMVIISYSASLPLKYRKEKNHAYD